MRYVGSNPTSAAKFYRNGNMHSSNEKKPIPPKPPALRFVCDACGELEIGKPHKSFLCRLVNGNKIIKDPYVFDETAWEWKYIAN